MASAVDVSLSMDVAGTARAARTCSREHECDELIELARPRLRSRAASVDPDGKHQVDQRRTSDGMFFALGETAADPTHRDSGWPILLGMPAIHGEGLQVLHYLPGQEYEPHFDWFDPRAAQLRTDHRRSAASASPAW